MGLILTTLLALSPAALAQDGSEEQAKVLYANGKMLFDEERYEDALKAWTRAYELSEQPLLLFNIALAHEKLGNHQEAIEFIYEYRIYAPKQEQESLIAKIDELKLLVNESPEEESPSEEVASEAEPAPPAADSKSETELEQSLAETASPVSETEAVPSEPLISPAGWAWSATALTGASGITLGILAAREGTRARDYCSQDDRGLCQPEAEPFLEHEATLALFSDLSSGLALLGGGTALWLSLRDQPTGSSGSPLRWWASPQSVGLSGSF